MAKFCTYCVLCLCKLTKLKKTSRFARQSKVSSANIQLDSEKEGQIVQIQGFLNYLFELQEESLQDRIPVIPVQSRTA